MSTGSRLDCNALSKQGVDQKRELLNDEHKCCKRTLKLKIVE